MLSIFYLRLAELLDLKLETLNGLYLRLYKNDVTPTRLLDRAAYTEADFTGYAPVGFIDWGTSFIDENVNARTDHDPVVFTQTGTGTTNNIYGYFVTDGAGTVMWFAERNPVAPVAMDATGKTYTVFPRFLEGIYGEL